MTEVIDLEQNQPNPFSDFTVIAFTLPEQMEAELSIFDVNGKLLMSQRGSYDQGRNELTVLADNLGISGVLYYRLTTGSFAITRKMIYMK